MAFIIEDILQKQHLNLSKIAYAIIERDMETFGQTSKSGMLNRIFENFRDDADASISIALEKRGRELEDILKGISLDSVDRNKVIKLFLKDKEKSLKAKALSYSKAITLKFRINNDNYEYLTAEEQECNEDRYYDSRAGKYIKAVIEEYARLPYIKREAIYYKERFDILERAIREQRQLKIMVKEGTVIKVKPFAILADPMSMYHYIVGIVAGEKYRIKEGQDSFSFRIASFLNVRILKEKAFISEAKQKMLEEEIRSKGVQFMSGEVHSFKVYLTNEGLKMYKRILHLRPEYISKEELKTGVYLEFLCTNEQIIYYFLKFGAEAKVVYPEEMVREFALRYKKANEMYK